MYGIVIGFSSVNRYKLFWDKNQNLGVRTGTVLKMGIE
jgi:hypothetical protein